MLLRRVVRGVAAEIDIDVLYEQFRDLMQLYAPSNCVNGGSPWRDLPAPSAAPTAPNQAVYRFAVCLASFRVSAPAPTTQDSTICALKPSLPKRGAPYR